MKIEDRFQAVAVALALAAVLVLVIISAPWWQEELNPSRPRAWPGILFGVARQQPALPAPGDAALQDAIPEILAGEPGLRAPRLEVAVSEGRVALVGPSPSLAVSRRAMALIAGLYGVRDVEDRTALAVARDSAARALEALREEPALAGLDLRVEADGRRTLLSGQVPSLGHRRLAEDAVAGVQGVGRLLVRLEVVPPVLAPDARLRGDVERRLRADALLEAGGLGLDVREGVVVLSGSVPTATEKARAARDAAVPGVREVQADRVEIKPARRAAETHHASRLDLDVARDLRDALRADPRLGDGVTVEVAEGVATLRGTVATLAARRAAVETARDVLGVLRVVDRLRPAFRRGPLRERVLAALARSPWLDEAPQVEERDGVIRLDGTVDDAWQRSRAQAAAEGVAGVLLVDNRLEVRDLQPLPDDPFLGDPTRLDSDPPFQPAATSDRRDEDLLRVVRERLRWNPYLVEGALEVQADSGVVTLAGPVRGPAEIRSARATALRAGAVRVNDKLTLEPR